MPKYVYRCTETGEEQELELTILQLEVLGPSWQDNSTGGIRNWKRVYLPPAGVHFKGSGWASKGG